MGGDNSLLARSRGSDVEVGVLWCIVALGVGGSYEAQVCSVSVRVLRTDLAYVAGSSSEMGRAPN